MQGKIHTERVNQVIWRFFSLIQLESLLQLRWGEFVFIFFPYKHAVSSTAWRPNKKLSLKLPEAQRKAKLPRNKPQKEIHSPTQCTGNVCAEVSEKATKHHCISQAGLLQRSQLSGSAIFLIKESFFSNSSYSSSPLSLDPVTGCLEWCDIPEWYKLTDFSVL